MQKPGDKSHWERIYQHQSAEQLGWFQAEPCMSLQLITQCKPASDDAIIDVGAGASRLTRRLLEQGFKNLTVLDISPTAIELARMQMGELADRVEWLTQDVTQCNSTRLYDVWHDRAVFHFLTDPGLRRGYVECLHASLRQHGHVIIAGFAITGPESCSGLPVVQYDKHGLGKVLGEKFRFIGQHDDRHVTPAGVEQDFSYFRFRKSA